MSNRRSVEKDPGEMEEKEEETVGGANNMVTLVLTDMSGGAIGRFAPNAEIDGVWIARVEVFGNSYFFHPGGIDIRPIDESDRRENSRVIELGETDLTQDDLMGFLRTFEVRQRFAEGKYNLRSNNSNHFADEVCRNFFGFTEAVPEPLLNQTAAVGRTIKGFVQSARQAFSAAVNEGFEEVGEEIEKMIELGAEDPTEEKGEEEKQLEKTEKEEPKKRIKFAKAPKKGQDEKEEEQQGSSMLLIDFDGKGGEKDANCARKPNAHRHHGRGHRGRGRPGFGQHVDRPRGPGQRVQAARGTGNAPTLEIELSLDELFGAIRRGFGEAYRAHQIQRGPNGWQGGRGGQGGHPWGRGRGITGGRGGHGRGHGHGRGRGHGGRGRGQSHGRGHRRGRGHPNLKDLDKEEDGELSVTEQEGGELEKKVSSVSQAPKKKESTGVLGMALRDDMIDFIDNTFPMDDEKRVAQKIKSILKGEGYAQLSDLRSTSEEELLTMGFQRGWAKRIVNALDAHYS